MMIQKTETLNKFIMLEYVCCAAIVLFTLLQWTAAVSFFFACSFLILVVNTFFTLREKLCAIGLFAVYLSVFALVFLLLNMLLKNRRIEFDYFVNYLMFASMILYLYLTTVISTNRRTAHFILKLSVLLSLLYPIAYFCFPLAEKYHDLYFNFSNPNLTGIWLLHSILYSFLAVLALKGAWRLLALFCCIADAWFLYLTHARNSWLALLLFAVIAVWLRLKKKPKFSNLFLLANNLLPVVFVPLYLGGIDLVTEKGWLNFLIAEGKPLGSRVKIWRSALARLNGHWLLGNYAELSGNMHNSFMVTLCSYGILVALATVGYLFAISWYANRKSSSKFDLCCLAAFFSALFLGIGEGALFSGGMGVNILAGGFLLLIGSGAELQTQEPETDGGLRGRMKF